MSKSKVKMQGMMDLREAIAHLEGVLENLKHGVITLSMGEDTVTLRPSAVVDVEIKASAKKDEEKFTLEMSWKRAPEVAVIKIGGNEPPTAA